VYPESLTKLLNYMSFNFHLPYRQTEDVVREYASRTSISVPEYK